MALGNCFPYLNRIIMEVRTLLTAKALNEQLLNNNFSILKNWQGIKGNTKSGHFKMGGVKRSTKPPNSKRRMGNTKSVHYEMEEQQNTCQKVFKKIQDDKENTDPVHFEMRKQQNTSLARGRLEVEHTVQGRTCGSLPRLLWFLVINICR
jgi:hypothetical protein